MKILKNTTGSIINITSLGLPIPASGQITIEVTDYMLLASFDSVAELSPLITSGDVVVNDGNEDLNVARGIAYIKHPDNAYSQKFDPTGSVLTETNTELAIKEASTTADTALNTPRYTLILQHNGTVSNNTFLGYSSLIPGDSTPVIIPTKSNLGEFAFSNSNSNADYTLEFRINSTTGTTFYSISKTNTKFFVDDIIDQDFQQGDEIYVKYIDNGNNASDASVLLQFKALP